MICFTSRESSEDPIYEDIDSLEASLSSIDNLHAVQEENTCDTYSKVHNFIIQYACCVFFLN